MDKTVNPLRVLVVVLILIGVAFIIYCLWSLFQINKINNLIGISNNAKLVSTEADYTAADLRN